MKIVFRLLLFIVILNLSLNDLTALDQKQEANDFVSFYTFCKQYPKQCIAFGIFCCICLYMGFSANKNIKKSNTNNPFFEDFDYERKRWAYYDKDTEQSLWEEMSRQKQESFQRARQEREKTRRQAEEVRRRAHEKLREQQERDRRQFEEERRQAQERFRQWQAFGERQQEKERKERAQRAGEENFGRNFHQSPHIFPSNPVNTLPPYLVSDETLQALYASNGISFKQTPFAVLGIQDNSSEGEIRDAFKKETVKWHPDKHTESVQSSDKATNRIKLINACRDKCLAMLRKSS